jgi:hypothetical protein
MKRTINVVWSSKKLAFLACWSRRTKFRRLERKAGSVGEFLVPRLGVRQAMVFVFIPWLEKG